MCFLMDPQSNDLSGRSSDQNPQVQGRSFCLVWSMNQIPPWLHYADTILVAPTITVQNSWADQLASENQCPETALPWTPSPGLLQRARTQQPFIHCAIYTTWSTDRCEATPSQEIMIHDQLKGFNRFAETVLIQTLSWSLSIFIVFYL